MKLLCVLLVAALVAFEAEGRIFQRCELVRELRNQGFPESKLRDWVCLVEHESTRNTNIIGKMNSDGSWDYGLFQINNRYWCSSTGAPGKECHVKCSDLLTDDITKASNCAKKIYSIHGFYAWNGWKSYCQSGLPDISSC